MSNVNKLRLALGGNPQRQNQFRVIVTPPTALSISASEIDRFTILAKDVSVPTSELGTVTLFQGGKPVKFPGDPDYPDLTVTYRVDANMFVHDYLYQWRELLFSHGGFSGTRNLDESSGEIIVEKLLLPKVGGEPVVIKRAIATNAFPLSVPDMGLDQDTMNDAVTLSVSFAYQDFTWERITTI